MERLWGSACGSEREIARRSPERPPPSGFRFPRPARIAGRLGCRATRSRRALGWFDVDAYWDGCIIAKVFFRFLLIFICAGILAQSGPLPVCQWDEAFDTSTRKTTVATFFAASNEIGVPASNDTLDEIIHDMLQQQSMGSSDSQFATATHLQGPVSQSLWTRCVPNFIEPQLGPVSSPVAFSTAPPSFCPRSLPLLI